MIKFIVYKIKKGLTWRKDEVFSPFDDSKQAEKEAQGWAIDRAHELENEGYETKVVKNDGS